MGRLVGCLFLQSNKARFASSKADGAVVGTQVTVKSGTAKYTTESMMEVAQRNPDLLLDVMQLVRSKLRSNPHNKIRPPRKDPLDDFHVNAVEPEEGVDQITTPDAASSVTASAENDIMEYVSDANFPDELE